MAATPLTDIVTRVRRQLKEEKARYWSDAELIDIMKDGIIDLWGAIIDLHQDHYFTVVEDGSVTQPSGASQLSGIPNDCFRVMLIEPLDTTVLDSVGGITYAPRKYQHPDFITARTLGSLDSVTTAGTIFYDIINAGAPIGAPAIIVAPKVSTTLALRFAYYPYPTIGTTNPIPGGSDNALKAWTLAYALAKPGDGAGVPDAGWLAVYATDKQTILTRMTPRQEQEPEMVDALFAGYW